ncbi:hypothetical protein ANTPLA_LOCUS6721 [Anthophora plagiata]
MALDKVAELADAIVDTIPGRPSITETTRPVSTIQSTPTDPITERMLQMLTAMQEQTEVMRVQIAELRTSRRDRPFQDQQRRRSSARRRSNSRSRAHSANDVSKPIIGADFLAHFGLLVDIRNQRLIDQISTITSKGTPVQEDSPSVKTVHGGSVYHELLQRFPAITRPSGTPSDVTHGTRHHIRTSPGPSIACRPRRLAPDRLQIAKKEFEAMAAHTQAPLNDLLAKNIKGNKPVAWTPEARKAFCQCKQDLAQAALLAHPEPNGTLAVTCDASNCMVGAALHQRIELVEKPIDFEALAASQLTDAELQALMQSPSGLNVKRLEIPGSTAKIFCDVSTDSVRPFLTVPFRRPAFDADSPKTILQSPYDGPYDVVSRDNKTIKVKIDNKLRLVSIDRVKPAYTIAEDIAILPDRTQSIPINGSTPSDTEPARNTTVTTPVTNTQYTDTIPPVPTQHSEPTARLSTRSGRRVRFPERFQAGFA